jgi:hypothetical protein
MATVSAMVLFIEVSEAGPKCTKKIIVLLVIGSFIDEYAPIIPTQYYCIVYGIWVSHRALILGMQRPEPFIWTGHSDVVSTTADFRTRKTILTRQDRMRFY